MFAIDEEAAVCQPFLRNVVLDGLPIFRPQAVVDTHSLPFSCNGRVTQAGEIFHPRFCSRTSRCRAAAYDGKGLFFKH
jgi:hypothetical protein